jgi:hypothetical protein
MAIATTTALAITGLAATAGTTIMSFSEARKQRRLQQDAEDKAAEMMADARKKLEVNYYDQLAIQKEPYELEREALISAGAQAIEAGVESERGAGAVAGRVQMAQQQGQREIAAAMGQEMLGLEKLSAQEESRLRDVGVELDLSEAEGAQIAAAQAAEAANMATAQGVEGIVSMGQQAVSMVPLYSRNIGAEKAALAQSGLGAFSSMSNKEYRKFTRGLTPEQRTKMFSNPDFLKAYEQTSQVVNPFFF